MHIQLNTNRPNIIINSFKAEKKEELPAKIDNETSNPILSEEKNINQKNNKSGKAYTIVTLAAVCSFVMLSKGFQKNANKFLTKIKKELEEKLGDTSFSDSKKQGNFYRFFIRRLNSFIKKSESINNITSLKDILFMKLMYKTKPTKIIHEKISKYFKKISQKTVFDSYKKTSNQFNKIYKTFDELDEFILKNSPDEIIEFEGKQYTKKELVEMARDNRYFVKTTVDAFMDKSAIKNRYNYIKEVTSTLYSTFWDASFKDFWSKNNKFQRKEMWQTFIAAEQIKGNKTQLADRISVARKVISFTKNDFINNIYECIKAIDSIIPVQDKDGIESIRKLELYSQNHDIFLNNKDEFLKELKKLKEYRFKLGSIKEADKAIEDYKKQNIELIEKQIADMEPGMLNDIDQGALQKMLNIYYKIAPLELEKTGILSAVKKAIKSFDESVNTECVDFFDKMRDLQLGSAPTDVLTILFSFIVLSYGFGREKEKDKRISVILKSGIPIAGGIATSMYSAAKLVSGGKSILLGLLSGIALNQLGVITNNIYKNRNDRTL